MGVTVDSLKTDSTPHLPPKKLEKQDPLQTPVKASIFLESNAEYILGQGLSAHPKWVLPGEGKPPFP